jgi:hypothetical protein
MEVSVPPLKSTYDRRRRIADSLRGGIFMRRRPFKHLKGGKHHAQITYEVNGPGRPSCAVGSSGCGLRASCLQPRGQLDELPAGKRWRRFPDSPAGPGASWPRRHAPRQGRVRQSKRPRRWRRSWRRWWWQRVARQRVSQWRHGSRRHCWRRCWRSCWWRTWQINGRSHHQLAPVRAREATREHSQLQGERR